MQDQQQSETRSRLLAAVAKLPLRDQKYYQEEINRLPPIIAEMSNAATVQQGLEGCQLQIEIQQWLAEEFQARLTALQA